MENRLIPRIVHQTFSTYSSIPNSIKSKNTLLEKLNSNYEFKYYDDQEVENWINEFATESQVNAFYRINPVYGAARADYFRYLLMYNLGGVYLDIKSTCLIPFDKFIRENDEFIYSKWPLAENGKRIFGLHGKLMKLNLDEIQQWFIICKPKSPLLANVIDAVTANLVREKSEKICNFGRQGVLETTGPIVYSMAVSEILKHNEVREISSFEEGLIYKSPGYESVSHIVRNSKPHYSQVMEPIIKFSRFGFFTFHVC